MIFSYFYHLTGFQFGAEFSLVKEKVDGPIFEIKSSTILFFELKIITFQSHVEARSNKSLIFSVPSMQSWDITVLISMSDLSSHWNFIFCNKQVFLWFWYFGVQFSDILVLSIFFNFLIFSYPSRISKISVRGRFWRSWRLKH